jgi:hypothetical protein
MAAITQMVSVSGSGYICWLSLSTVRFHAGQRYNHLQFSEAEVLPEVFHNNRL